MAKLVL